VHIVVLLVDNDLALAGFRLASLCRVIEIIVSHAGLASFLLVGISDTHIGLVLNAACYT
jgi:UDP-N-acetylglucosamine transferase subunit ALG13